MAGVRVYCRNCKRCDVSKPKGTIWITLILLLFYIVPGIIYEIWRNSGLGVCKSCGSEDLLREEDKPIQPPPQLTTAFSNYSPTYEKPSETVKQVNCPDCREMIRFDARKCKHCGSYVDVSQ